MQSVLDLWRNTVGWIFECEILLIANCESLHKMQSKESQEKEYTINNITHDLTPFACVLACDPKHACFIDITCMHVRDGRE